MFSPYSILSICQPANPSSLYSRDKERLASRSKGGDGILHDTQQPTSASDGWSRGKAAVEKGSELWGDTMGTYAVHCVLPTAHLHLTHSYTHTHTLSLSFISFSPSLIHTSISGASGAVLELSDFAAATEQFKLEMCDVLNSKMGGTCIVSS